MEKFGLSIKNLSNLWSFIKVYVVFVPNLCGEKSVWRKSVSRKNDKYEVWNKVSHIVLQFFDIVGRPCEFTDIRQVEKGRLSFFSGHVSSILII